VGFEILVAGCWILDAVARLAEPERESHWKKEVQRITGMRFLVGNSAPGIELQLAVTRQRPWNQVFVFDDPIDPLGKGVFLGFAAHRNLDPVASKQTRLSQVNISTAFHFIYSL